MDIYPKFLETLFQTTLFGLILIIVCILKKYNNKYIIMQISFILTIYFTLMFLYNLIK